MIPAERGYTFGFARTRQSRRNPGDGESLPGVPANEVHRVVEEVLEVHVVGHRVVVAEDDGHVDGPLTQLTERDIWVHFGKA
jgi:hypothetical protein